MHRTRIRGRLHADLVVHVGRILRAHRELAAGNPHHACRRRAGRRLRALPAVGSKRPDTSGSRGLRIRTGGEVRDRSAAITPTATSSHRGVAEDCRDARERFDRWLRFDFMVI